MIPKTAIAAFLCAGLFAIDVTGEGAAPPSVLMCSWKHILPHLRNMRADAYFNGWMNDAGSAWHPVSTEALMCLRCIYMHRVDLQKCSFNDKLCLGHLSWHS